MVKRITALLFMVCIFGYVQGAENFKPVPITTLSLNEAWQRQQVILTLEIPTPDEFARLEIEELNLSDFEVIELPFERVGSQNKYKIKVGWILFPLVEGHYEIELPKTYYRPNSGRKIKLKIPPQKLSVKSLPSYIPATMPIGEVAIKNTVQAGKLGNLHDTQTLINWNVELVTTNVLPQTIPPILRQVKTSKSLDIFPETLEKKTTKAYEGLQNNFHYKIPVKALRSGPLDLPTLSIQYFDPSDGKLKRANAQVLNHWTLHRYLQWFLLAVAVFVLLIILLRIIQLIRAYIIKWQLIRQAIEGIEEAKNTQEIRTALHNLSQAKGWCANSTLQQVLMDWESQKGEDSRLDKAFKALQLEQFGGKSLKSFESIKKELIDALKTA